MSAGSRIAQVILLIVTSGDTAPPSHVTFMLNFAGDLRRRAATR